MDIEEIEKEIQIALGKKVEVIEAKLITHIDHSLLEELYTLWHSYPDSIKNYVQRYIPTGLEIDTYIGMVHILRVYMEWIPLQEHSRMTLQTISIINARIFSIVRDMSGTAKNRFCSRLNSMVKHLTPGDGLPANGNSHNN